jgi:hypothetical protein
LLPDPEKKNFSHFFNITSMGEKLISKNHLTPPPPPFLSTLRSKINKNQGMIFESFKMVKDLQHGEIDY